jgi:sugar O-acyltransferase (sialic acid O-acetyltransferase NeuD family)
MTSAILTQREKIVVVGNGKHAKVVTDIIEDMGKYDILGFVVGPDFKDHKFLGYPVLGHDDILMDLYHNKEALHIAIGIGGWEDNNTLRKRIYLKIKEIGFHLPNIIHPTAIISKNVILGEGNVIFPGAVINTECVLHDNVVIATGSTIDHETIIHSNVLVSAGVTVGGNVNVGEGCLLALGSKVISDTCLAENVLVAAGAVVVKDCSVAGKYFGIPAKRVT